MSENHICVYIDTDIRRDIGPVISFLLYCRLFLFGRTIHNSLQSTHIKILFQTMYSIVGLHFIDF